jgi:hypothetical protein
MRQKHIAAPALDPGLILRRADQVEFGAAHEIVGVVLDSRMTETHVIGDKIEHEPQAAPLQPFAQPGQAPVAAELFVDGVAGDGETRAWNIVVAQIVQCLVELLPPAFVATGDLLRRGEFAKR